MSELKPDSDYEAFAGAYERHWSSEVSPQLMTVIEELLVPRLSPGARVLDLCCGTGYTVAELARRGFRVTGLDASSQMLARARRNAPRAHFIRADARRFDSPGAYDAVVSTFDSLNHILTLSELTKVFRNVYRALAPAGLFLFDMNMERAFLEHWVEHFSIVEHDEVCILRGDYDRKQKRAHYDITIFQLKGKMWRRTDAVINERCYSMREIKRALREAGFRETSLWDAEKELGLSDHTGRTFFLAAKNP